MVVIKPQRGPSIAHGLNEKTINGRVKSYSKTRRKIEMVF